MEAAARTKAAGTNTEAGTPTQAARAVASVGGVGTLTGMDEDEMNARSMARPICEDARTGVASNKNEAHARCSTKIRQVTAVRVCA